jgi:hypothetical protein
MKASLESDTEYFEFTDVAPVESIQLEVEETDAEEAAAIQSQVTIAPTLDSSPGAFQQPSFVEIGLGNTEPLLDL